MSFISLLQASLRKNYSISSNLTQEGWEYAYAWAKEQSVIGLLYPIVERLYQKDEKLKKIHIRWKALNEQVVNTSKKVEDDMHLFLAQHENYAVQALFWGGPIVATEYGTEAYQHRTTQFEVLLDESLWTDFVASLRHENASIKKELQKDATIQYVSGETSVILRCHLLHLSGCKSQEAFKQLEPSFFKTARKVNVAGREVMTLGINETILCLTLRMLRNVLNGKLNLMQLCDFTIFLIHHHHEMDKEWLKTMLQRVGHEHAFAVFEALGVKYLGLAMNEVPLPFDVKDSHYAEKLFNHVMECQTLHQANKEGMEHSVPLKIVLKQSRHFHYLAPAEANWYWCKRKTSSPFD